MLTRLIRGMRALLQRALQERASPLQTALSVAVGVFSSCTPFIGAHIWIALGLATLFRLNRLWAVVGSRATPSLLLPFVAFAEIQLSHRVRTGAWVPLTAHDILAHGHELLLDWMLGTPIIGGAYAAVLGAIAYAVARRRRRLSAVTPSTPGGLPPASSGSPPSAPPSPTR